MQFFKFILQPIKSRVNLKHQNALFIKYKFKMQFFKFIFQPIKGRVDRPSTEIFN